MLTGDVLRLHTDWHRIQFKVHVVSVAESLQSGRLSYSVMLSCTCAQHVSIRTLTSVAVWIGNVLLEVFCIVVQNSRAVTVLLVALQAVGWSSSCSPVWVSGPVTVKPSQLNVTLWKMMGSSSVKHRVWFLSTWSDTVSWLRIRVIAERSPAPSRADGWSDTSPCASVWTSAALFPEKDSG